MPPYDCMFLFKPHIRKEAVMDLVVRVGKHVCRRNGVVTDIKSLGKVQLGYGVKKLDGRYYQGLLMQMSMMATPEINKELHYLNKEDRLLRWLLVKQRNTKFGLDSYGDEGRYELSKLSQIGKHGDEDEENRERKMEKQNEEEEEQKKKKKSSVVIRIPSYQEVVESSQAKSTPSSLFVPSQTFSEAFAFVKSSDFYSPPPKSRETGQSDAPSSTSTPSPATAAASSTIPSSQNRNSILVSHRQKGNPLLKHIRNVRWAFADVVCDYMLGQSSCALYLSLRYHLLHPDYLYYRIRELQKNFKLRVVLCHVDVEDVIKPLLEVTKTAMLHDCTLLCGWSLEECGRYLETIKVYENKPADIIQGQMDTDYLSRLTHSLTTVRHVNKTDVVTLGTTFGSLSNIMGASMEDLARCPGIGERKVKRLFDTFHEPFKRVESSRQAIPETSVQNKPASPESSIRNKAESSSLIEDKQEDTEDVSKRRKKEPEVTVKSALSAAFAKYSGRVGKRKSTSQVEEKEESIISKESEAET